LPQGGSARPRHCLLDPKSAESLGHLYAGSKHRRGRHINRYWLGQRVYAALHQQVLLGFFERIEPELQVALAGLGGQLVLQADDPLAIGLYLSGSIAWHRSRAGGLHGPDRPGKDHQQQ